MVLKTRCPLLCEVTRSILTSLSSTHFYFISHCSHHCHHLPMTIIIISLENQANFLIFQSFKLIFFICQIILLAQHTYHASVLLSFVFNVFV